MRHTILVAAALIVAASPAGAGIKFAAYEGPNAVQVGHGGTKVAARGIDFWTMGSPARKFQVLGVITDERNDKPITKILGGDAVGSRGIASKVLQAGGNAVIVIDQNDRSGGIAGFVSWGQFTNFGARQVRVTKTQMLVIRYLENDASMVAATPGLNLQLGGTAAGMLSSTGPALSAGSSSALPPGVKSLGADVWLYPAPTTSGHCIQAPADYRGTGSSSRPAITGGLPRCSARNR